MYFLGYTDNGYYFESVDDGLKLYSRNVKFEESAFVGNKGQDDWIPVFVDDLGAEYVLESDKCDDESDKGDESEFIGSSEEDNEDGEREGTVDDGGDLVQTSLPGSWGERPKRVAFEKAARKLKETALVSRDSKRYALIVYKDL